MNITAAAATDTNQLDRAGVRRALVPASLGATAVPVVLSALEAHSLPEALTEIAIELIAAALLFAVLVPRGLRKPSAGIRGTISGAAAVLLVYPAFWTGLPMLLGVAGLLLGLAGRRAARGAGTAIASLVLGAAGIVGYIAIYVIDAAIR